MCQNYNKNIQSSRFKADTAIIAEKVVSIINGKEWSFKAQVKSFENNNGMI